MAVEVENEYNGTGASFTSMVLVVEGTVLFLLADFG